MVGQACTTGSVRWVRPSLSSATTCAPRCVWRRSASASVLFVFTHDSVGVGEDGPTHEPVEHLMSLRAMPRLHVVRPSDANETLDLVERLLCHPHPAPTALVLTRQDVAVLDDDDARASTRGAARGGYVVREDPEARFTLVGTGSEVAHCLSANAILRERGVPTRVVAMPCWRCFDAQDEPDREEVLRPGLASVSLEAGATLGWDRDADHALGIDDFGMSAPGRSCSNTSVSTPRPSSTTSERLGPRHVTTLTTLYERFGQSPWIDNMARPGSTTGHWRASWTTECAA